MNLSKGSVHVTTTIQDYVLGMLSDEESERVTKHIAKCPQCRARVQEERQIAKSVRETLLAVTRPNPAALQRLFPRASIGRSGLLNSASWARQTAIAAILLLLLAVGLTLESSVRNDMWSGKSVATRIDSVIVTQTPTLTATSTSVSSLWPRDPESTVINAEYVGEPRPVLTPVPMATYWH